MRCARCQEELPESTPVCPGCGPIVIGAGFGPTAEVLAAVTAPAPPPLPTARGGPATHAAPRRKEKRDRGLSTIGAMSAAADVRPRAFTAPPTPILVLALSDVLSGLALGLAAATIFSRPDQSDLVRGLQCALSAALLLSAAPGLFLLRPWGRTLQLALCVWAFIGLGSILGALLIAAYLGRPAAHRFFQQPATATVAPGWEGVSGQPWTVVAGAGALFQAIVALSTAGPIVATLVSR